MATQAWALCCGYCQTRGVTERSERSQWNRGVRSNSRSRTPQPEFANQAATASRLLPRPARTSRRSTRSPCRGFQRAAAAPSARSVACSRRRPLLRAWMSACRGARSAKELALPLRSGRWSSFGRRPALVGVIPLGIPNKRNLDSSSNFEIHYNVIPLRRRCVV